MPANITVLYEDSDLLVLDKPVGVSVGDLKSGDIQDSVLEWLGTRTEVKPGTGVTDFVLRLGILHRLDKETSGVMLVAKNRATFDYISELFRTRQVKKTYEALVHGWVKDTDFEIRAPVGRDRRVGVKFAVGERGRESVTRFKLIQKLKIAGQDYSYLESMPETGRTHQIRVHLAALGRPIVGDIKYLGKNLLNAHKTPFTRMMLHAKTIEFTDNHGLVRKFASPLTLAAEF